jgi:hypothetical protein
MSNYRELKRLILEKRKAIVVNDLKALSGITSQIELLIVSNNQLEANRMTLVSEIAKTLNLSESKPTLAQIADRIKSPLSEKLMELRRDTVEAIKEVQRQNRINSEMLKYSSNLMDSILRRIVDGESFEPTYGSTGKTTRKRASATLLDQHF